MVQETTSSKLFEKSSSLAGVNCQKFYHQLQHRVLVSASLHCVSQGPQAVGRLIIIGALWSVGRNESIFATGGNSFCTEKKISSRKTLKQRRQRRDGHCWWWKREHKQRRGIFRRAPGHLGIFTAPSPIALRGRWNSVVDRVDDICQCGIKEGTQLHSKGSHRLKDTRIL